MWLSAYAKNILFFLLFTAFVGIIIPRGKYKQYISLVTGLILIYLLIQPVLDVLGGRDGIPVNQIFGGVTVAKQSSGTAANAGTAINISAYEALQNEMIHKVYVDQLTRQIESIVKREHYTLNQAEIQSSDDYGELVSLVLDVSPDETEKSKPFIRVQPVKIGTSIQNTAEDERAKKLKKLVSDFYQIPEDHILIHITEPQKKS